MMDLADQQGDARAQTSRHRGPADADPAFAVRERDHQDEHAREQRFRCPDIEQQRILERVVMGGERVERVDADAAGPKRQRGRVL